MAVNFTIYVYAYIYSYIIKLCTCAHPQVLIYVTHYSGFIHDMAHCACVTITGIIIINFSEYND